MKVRDLVFLLMQENQDHDVVLQIHNSLSNYSPFSFGEYNIEIETVFDNVYIAGEADEEVD